MIRGQLSFYRNAQPLGTAFSGLGGRWLVPAICIGSNRAPEGETRFSAVRVVPPCVIRFDPARCNRRILLDGDIGLNRATTTNKWSTAIADHQGIRRGVLTFAVRVDVCEGGIAIGVVDARRFDTAEHNLGTGMGSWALSKSGKKSDGSGWVPYVARPTIGAGTILGLVLNMNAGTLEFFIDGASLGVAFEDLHMRGVSLTPALCVGSNTGGSECCATIIPFEGSQR